MPNLRNNRRHRKRGARASNGGSRPRAPVKSLLPRSQSEPSLRHQETVAQERDEGDTPREEDEKAIDNDNQREREEKDEMMLVRQHSCPDSGIDETIGVEIAAGPLVAPRSIDALISSGNGVKIREWIEIRLMLYNIMEDAEDEEDETSESFWTDGTTIGGDGTTTGGGGTSIGGDAQSLGVDNPAVSDVFSDLSSRHGSALGRSPSDAPSLRSETPAVTLKAGNL